MKTIRIGGGAGYAGDRIEPAVELVEAGDLDYLIFECLGERTIALAQHARLADPDGGYNPQLRARMEAVLPTCHSKGIRVITNMGAANPRAAGTVTVDVAHRHGLHGLTVATVIGDDVLELVRARDPELEESRRRVSDLGDALVSANAYLGAEPIVEALSAGASVVMTGRVADPSLALAAEMHAFGWSPDDWALLGQGTVVGHLIECAGQITGGYFADPGYKDVAGLAHLGFPIAVVDPDGTAVITKVAGSGGRVTVRTCKEQLLYEVHRPDRYITPDTVADFSTVTFDEVGSDAVRVAGGSGQPRPEMLKVSVGYTDGFRGEGQISYAGPGAASRARLAGQVVAERLALTGVRLREIRYDMIGVDSLHGTGLSSAHPEPYEARLRVVARTDAMHDATQVGREVETLLTNGPAGGGGASTTARQTLRIESTYLERSDISTNIEYLVAK